MKKKNFLLFLLSVISLFYITNMIKPELSQAQSSEQTTIDLYTYKRCPACVKVKNFLEKNNLTHLINIIDASMYTNQQQLIKLTTETLGRQNCKQCPFLYDHETSTGMLESSEIIKYLTQKFLN